MAPKEVPGVADEAQYAAFGDSYSSGEGTLAYLPGTGVPGTNVCHRSLLAYSGRLAADLKLQSTSFAACSGAVTADLFAPNSNQNRAPNGSLEPAQLCQPQLIDAIAPCGDTRGAALGLTTKIVTLTIGGNDVGFANVVRSCVYGTSGKYRVGLPGRGCSVDPLIVEPALRRLGALNGVGQQVTSPTHTIIRSFSSVLDAIHVVAPNAHVFIAGYPQLFQSTSSQDCLVGSADGVVPLKIAASDAQALDRAAGLVDSSIAAAATRAGNWASYVDAASLFDGHGLCSSSPWINPIKATFTFDRTGRTVGVSVDPSSVHPTVEGQAAGYEQAFLAAGFGR